MENLYITKLVKCGSSLGIIIPKQILRAVEMQRGDTIIFGKFEKGSFRVTQIYDAEVRALKTYLERKTKPIQYE